MPDNEFPYGQEFNPVGGEFNEQYTSHVQGQRSSFKQEDLQNNSVQDIEQASTVPAGEATADALSGSATSSGVTATPTTATAATAGGATTTTTTIVTTTGVVATGGVVIGAIIIAAAAANIFSRSFSFSVEPMSRSISYDLTVEFQTDNKLYVSILDGAKQEVAVNTHELTVNDAHVEEGKLFYDITGSFTGLNTDIDYTLEAYAFDASGVRFNVYTSDTSFVVPYTPVTGVSNFRYSENPIEGYIEFSFDVTIEEETTIYAHLLNENGEEVVLEEFPVDKGNGAAVDGPVTTTVNGFFSDIEAGVNYIFEAYGIASDGNQFTIYRHDEPLRLGTSGVQNVDGFEFSFDVFNKKALIFYSLVINDDDTVFTRIVDENDTIYGTVSNEVKLEDASLDGDIYYASVETQIGDLQPGIDYYFEVYVIDSENNEIVLYRTEGPATMASTNIISISKPTYTGNGYARTLDYQFDIVATASDAVYVTATNIASGTSLRTNQHEFTFDTSGANEQTFTITGTLMGVIPGEEYTFEVSANDSDKEPFTFYTEDGVSIATIPISYVGNFVTTYDEIEKSISYEFDVDTDEGHSVYVQLENEQRQQLDINEHFASPSASAATGLIHLDGKFEDVNLNTPYYFSIYAFDSDDQQIELFASVEPVEIPTPTFGITGLSITADPVRKAIRVNASLYYDENNFGKYATIELLDSNEQAVSGDVRLSALTPEEALDNEHVRSDGVLYYYDDGYTFNELTSGETYTVVISYLDYESSQTAPTQVILKQQDVLLETSGEYLPYISLISYEADNMEQVVYLYYEYRDNGITYDHFDVLVENINGPDTLSDEYQDVGNGPADNGNAVSVSMEGSSGYSYSIKLYGVDSLGNRTLLIQHAIYY